VVLRNVVEPQRPKLGDFDPADRMTLAEAHKRVSRQAARSSFTKTSARWSSPFHQLRTVGAAGRSTPREW